MSELKIVVFNGSPRCGKGIAAKHLTKLVNSLEGNLPAFHMEFKDELFKIASNVLGISIGEFLTDYERKTPDNVWWMKDLVSLSTSASMKVVGERKNYSQREWLIHISENVIKPSFGKDAFGKALVNSLPESGVVFISDSGFKEELQPVIDHVGADNVMVVRIQREGCTFDGDSRSYLTPCMFKDPIQFYEISNNGTEVAFLSEVEDMVGGWL